MCEEYAIFSRDCCGEEILEKGKRLAGRLRSGLGVCKRM
jgi:hypothetical protein